MSNNFTFLVMTSDLVADAASVTADSAMSGFPATNLKYDVDGSISKVFKTNLSLTLDLLIDKGNTSAWDLVVLLNHNFTSAATVTIKAGTTNATSDYSQSMTWREFDMWYLKAASVTYRYILITVSDPTNPAGYLSIGGVRIGGSTTVAKNFDWGFDYEYQSQNRVSRTDLGAASVDRLIDQVQITLQWSVMPTTAKRDEIVDFLKSMKGQAIPAFIILNPSASEGYYVRLMTMPKDTRNFYSTINRQTFLEESRGLKL